MKPTFCVPGGELPTREQLENRNLADALFDAQTPGKYVIHDGYDEDEDINFSCICGVIIDERPIVLAPTQYIYELADKRCLRLQKRG